MRINFKAIAEKILKDEGFFFIAEVSNNHLGDLERLKKIIIAAKESGAHAVKIQTYTASSLCLEVAKSNHQIKSGPWAGQSYWELYKSMEVPLYWSLEARDFADSIGIPIFSSPFSPLDVKYLVKNNFDMLKVASGEFGCPELIDSIIDSGVPFMASTGFADEQELKWLNKRLKQANNSEQIWCLFNCVSNYPSGIDQLDLAKFGLLSNYSKRVGLSDHSLDSSSILASVLAGARIFEKHLTLSREDGGPDAFFSLEPGELKDQIQTIKLALSNPTLERASLVSVRSDKAGKASLSFSRSLYAKKYIAEGALLTLENVGSFRPSHQEPALVLDQIIGKTAKGDIRPGDPVYTCSVI
jgi:pseudaminic acid synthase